MHLNERTINPKELRTRAKNSDTYFSMPQVTVRTACGTMNSSSDCPDAEEKIFACSWKNGKQKCDELRICGSTPRVLCYLFGLSVCQIENVATMSVYLARSLASRLPRIVCLSHLVQVQSASQVLFLLSILSVYIQYVYVIYLGNMPLLSFITVTLNPINALSMLRPSKSDFSLLFFFSFQVS